MSMLHYQPKLFGTFLDLLFSNLLCTFLIAINNNVHDKDDVICTHFQDPKPLKLSQHSKIDLP